MYGLPKHFDYSMFVGRVVDQVSFMEHTVRICFDDGIDLDIESSYAHQVGPSEDAHVTKIPPQESTLMQLAGQTVQAAAAEGEGTLVLRFAGGQALKCFDDSPMYESYKITHHGEETIV